METNNLTIIPPKGMEAYQEGNEIKFRPIKETLTYNKIAKELFENKNVWRIANYNVDKYNNTPNWNFYTNCTSEKQAQKLLAINKLMNVARYLNDGWQPDWEEHNSEFKWYINLYHRNIDISYTTHYNGSFVYFKSQELAQQAIEILGEETIKLALSTDW